MGFMSDFTLELQGYRLTTAQILYHMPDHPGLLQEFIWQHYDLAPKFPRLHKFLDFWAHEIDGTLHSVYIAKKKLIGPTDSKFCDFETTLQ
jgi:uncharacterized protein Usg